LFAVIFAQLQAVMGRTVKLTGKPPIVASSASSLHDVQSESGEPHFARPSLFQKPVARLIDKS
jgi:hypothetical protein